MEGAGEDQLPVVIVRPRPRPGGLADVQVQGVTSDPRASLIEGLLARGKEDEALAELDRIDERIVARMSGLAGGLRLLTVREALDGIALAHEQVGRQDDSLLIPLADDGHGMWHALDLDRSGGAAIVELDEGEARVVAASFTAWLAELVGHGVHLPGHGWTDE